MTQSLYSKLKSAAMVSYEKEMSEIPAKIALMDKARSLCEAMGKDSLCPIPSVSVTAEKVALTYTLEKYDGKVIWLEMERISDHFGFALELVVENQQAGCTNIYMYHRKPYIDIYFSYSAKCIPIVETKMTEVVVGYKCG